MEFERTGLGASANAHGGRDPDVLRLWLVFLLVVLAIVALLLAFGIGLRSLEEPSGDVVATLVATVASTIGTLVGFVAGLKLGSSGVEKVRQHADALQQRLDAVAETNGDVMSQVAARHPALFPHLARDEAG